MPTIPFDLREALQESDLEPPTQRELARKMRVSKVTVSHWMTGRSKPSDKHLAHLKRLLRRQEQPDLRGMLSATRTTLRWAKDELARLRAARWSEDDLVHRSYDRAPTASELRVLSNAKTYLVYSARHLREAVNAADMDNAWIAGEQAYNAALYYADAERQLMRFVRALTATRRAATLLPEDEDRLASAFSGPHLRGVTKRFALKFALDNVGLANTTERVAELGIKRSQRRRAEKERRAGLRRGATVVRGQG